MVFENKEFTKIKGYDNYFICRETTEVLSSMDRKNTTKNTFKILKQVNNSKNINNNYYIVTLTDANGNKSNKAIHRLMAETFIPNPNDKAHVNHIDGNKLNNKLDNLEWATPQENSQHAVSTGLSTYTHAEKEVHQYELCGTYIASFSSDVDAEASTSVARQNISKCTLGLRQFAGGYQWSRVKLDHMLNLSLKIVKCFKVNNIIIEGNSTSEVASLVGCNRVTVTSKLNIKNPTTINGHLVERIYFN